VTSENKKKDMGESVNALRGFELERKFEDDRKQLSRLTKREREVYRLLAKSYKEIAGALGITEHTARARVENILHKLGVSRRIEIVGKNWPKSQ
jgi:DNA-binding CsgD family transcriptional regulator